MGYLDKESQEARERLANNIRVLMDWAGIENPNQLWTRTNDAISVQQIRNVLAGRSGASVDTIYHLAKALRVDMAFLLARDGFTQALASGDITPDEVIHFFDLLYGTTRTARIALLRMAEEMPRADRGSFDQ